MRVTKKHYDAFNYWFGCTQEGLNTTESVEATAEHFDMSPHTVWKWYYGMDWKSDAQRRMREIQKELERRDNRTFAQNQKKYLDILHRLLYEYVEDGLPAKIESVKDLEIVIKNSLLLQDHPTENIKSENDTIHGGSVGVEAQGLFDRDKMKQIISQEKENSE